jgi:wyosine [tRNA(Phe)-imidazoG37] synthetase (radical SAM superfamily)
LNFRADSHQPSRDEVQRAVEQKMIELTEKGEGIDVITFAGNGEPTTHRDFPAIIDDIVALRDKYFPEAKISVLSNATMIWKDEVRAALAKVDNNIQKLDSAKDETVKIINQPQGRYSVEKVIDDMRRFEGEVIVQTLFLRGEVNGVKVDNTTEEEVAAWIEALKVIQPKEVMLYSLDRKTPYDTLYKVEGDELQVIADRVEALGIKTQVTK